MHVTVKASARLHFGFIDLDGSMGRIFGSIGVAIDRPSVVIEASRSDRLHIDGDEDGRAAAMARRFLRHHHIRAGARIAVKETIPAHVGLGSGTQLALSLATALARLHAIDASVRDHALVMGRGRRSGIGIAAFERGGFIVDGGRRIDAGDRGPDASSLPPALVRHPFPDTWTFVVAIPPGTRGLTGEVEGLAFRRLHRRPARSVARLSRIVLVQLLPSLAERDPVAFGRALTGIQRIMGGWFRGVQGGAFSSPLGARIARAMARAGALGVGQSSWGPAIYGLAAGPGEAEALEEAVRRALPDRIDSAVFQAKANNRGARIHGDHHGGA